MIDIEVSESEKKNLFERFLTYRRRMARICSVQALYLYEIRQKNEPKQKLGRKELESEITTVCKNILYCYKNVFFTKQEHGSDKKNKQIDEKYFFDITLLAAKDITRIDGIIEKYLNEKWTVARLDSVIRSILRCAVCEVLYEPKTEIAILTSEYTTIASHFFNGKEIGFINGIVDKIGKDNRRTDGEA